MIIIVRLATGKNVNQLPTHTKPYNSLPLWNGGMAIRPQIRADVSISTRFGYRGEYFSSPTRGMSYKFNTGG